MKTSGTFGDLFLLGRNLEEVIFFSGGHILYERGTFSVKMVAYSPTLTQLCGLGIFDHVKGVPPGCPNPDSISDQKLSFFTPAFRPGF